MKSFLAKAVIAGVFSVVSAGAAFADAPVAISCPSLAALNNVVKTQGLEGLENFTDQGRTWSAAIETPLAASMPVQSFLGVMIPTKLGHLQQIQCWYGVLSRGPVNSGVAKTISAMAVFNADPGPFLGETGIWYAPAKSNCNSPNTTGCTFVKDNS